MSGKHKATMFRVAGVVSLFWVVSISLVFLNKWLLGNSGSHDVPLFVTWFQCATTAALCYGAMSLGELNSQTVMFPKLNFSYKTAIEILPLSIVFVMMIGLNNLCLKFLSVSFYYLARSLTTVFNVVLSYVILKKPTSRNALICCGVIVFGYGSGVNAEGALGDMSLFGVLLGVASSLFCALQPIFTAKGLPIVENSVWRLTFYSNLNASFLFTPFVLWFEATQLFSEGFLLDLNFWSMLLISGFLGFALGYVSAWQIQVTSPLTHNVSGTAKAAAQTILGVFIFHEIKSLAWWASNLLVILGSGAYAYVRHAEMSGPSVYVKVSPEDPSQVDGNDKKPSMAV